MENLTDFSRDSDGGSEREYVLQICSEFFFSMFEVTSTRLSACKHDGGDHQQDKERYAR